MDRECRVTNGKEWLRWLWRYDRTRLYRDYLSGTIRSWLDQQTTLYREYKDDRTVTQKQTLDLFLRGILISFILYAGERYSETERFCRDLEKVLNSQDKPG